MLKRVLTFVLLLGVLLFNACSSANQYNLSLVADGSDSKDYIYYDDERVVYVVGGIMMIELDGESLMLESALNEGKITVADILSSAQTDADNEDIGVTAYPDGSMEYAYDGFNLIVLNTAGVRDVYFVPSSVDYYSIVN